MLVLPEAAVHRLLEILHKVTEDFNSCVILSNKEYQDRWCLVLSSISDKCTFRKIVHCNNITKEKTILSETSIYNIHSGGSSLILPTVTSDLVIRHDVQFVPHYGSMVLLARVQSGGNYKESTKDVAICNFFKTQKYLCKGDIIRIDIKKYNTEAIYSGEDVMSDDLYYRVEKIDGPEYENTSSDIKYGYLVDRIHTTVKEAASVQCFLPFEMKLLTTENFSSIEYLEEKALVDFIPLGLHSYYEEIKNWVVPFLGQKVDKLRPIFLLTGKSGTGKGRLLAALAKRCGLKYLRENSILLKSENSAITEASLERVFARIPNVTPCLLHFQNIEALCKDDSGSADYRIIEYFTNSATKLKSEYAFVIFGTTSDVKNLSPKLLKIFLQHLKIGALDSEQRLSVLNWALKRDNLVIHENLDELIPLTSSFVFSDFIQLIFRATKIYFSKQHPLKYPVTESEKPLSHKKGEPVIHLSKDDLIQALDEMNSSYSASVGAPQIPDTSWDDVGGLNDLKKEILNSLASTNLPDGLQRSGLLLYGPPGTGKTLLAKAVATHCKYSFLSVKGPELLNQYIGQSEENVREVFSVARASAPCVIFFDELDSLAPKRGMSGTSGGVMDRVVSQLLTEMDGIQKLKGIFILGATNRPDLIDPALLRPGRLDKMLYVGVQRDHQSRLSILKAVTRKFIFSESVDLSELVDMLPANRDITGADFYSICSNGWLNAARRHITESQNNKKQLALKVTVSREDMADAFMQFMGSISP